MFLRTFYVTVVSMDYVTDENLTDEEEIMNLESPGPSNIKRARKEIINYRLSAALRYGHTKRDLRCERFI